MRTGAKRLPGLVLGYHGCDASVGEKVLCGEDMHLKLSTNKYDWLGDGVYFWENDPVRAMEFAQASLNEPHITKGKIKTPFVLGAVIDLGFCLNLMDRAALEEVANVYKLLKQSYKNVNEPLPKNGKLLRTRSLDKAVIDSLHTVRDSFNTKAETRGLFPPYETVRSAFPEGPRLYPGAGFRAKNHIQIAVKDVGAIKGYFRPIPE